MAIKINGVTVIDDSRVGNLTAATATGNITGGNLISNAAISAATTINATGNITGGNLSGTNVTGTLTTAAQPNITSVGTLSSLSVTGNVSAGNLSGTNGAFTNISGTLTTAAQTNITSVGTLGALTVTGNIQGGNLVTTGGIFDTGALAITTASNGNITLSPNGTGVIIASKDIINGQANGVGNIGSSTTYFNTVFAKATSAQYADLAEMYTADQILEPGTVVCFGGSQEITVCDQDSSPRVAGVISTNPSYIMNAGLAGDNVTAVALTGRVPTRVTGTVCKGDMMVAAGGGRARAESNPQIGTVIGKALADFDGAEGMIEVVIGRL